MCSNYPWVIHELMSGDLRMVFPLTSYMIQLMKSFVINWLVESGVSYQGSYSILQSLKLEWDFSWSSSSWCQEKTSARHTSFEELAMVTDCYTNIYIITAFTPSSATSDPTNDRFTNFQPVLILYTPEPTHQLLTPSITWLRCSRELENFTHLSTVIEHALISWVWTKTNTKLSLINIRYWGSGYKLSSLIPAIETWLIKDFIHVY